ncbi:hypothetical protein AB0C34_31470, partial [Nocardia sp. NPDC049220]|uniref:hypothetical protein n=1 Tax=Nocardia sp. NPDC049220 TaxID=3155273 RepID=UPI0033D2EE69
TAARRSGMTTTAQPVCASGLGTAAVVRRVPCGGPRPVARTPQGSSVVSTARVLGGVRGHPAGR